MTQSAECVFVCSWSKFASGVVVVSFVHLGCWVDVPPTLWCGVASRLCSKFFFCLSASLCPFSVDCVAVTRYFARMVEFIHGAPGRQRNDTVYLDTDELLFFAQNFSQKGTNRNERTVVVVPKVQFSRGVLELTFPCVNKFDHLKIAFFSFHHWVGFSRAMALSMFLFFFSCIQLQFQIPHSFA